MAEHVGVLVPVGRGGEREQGCALGVDGPPVAVGVLGNQQALVPAVKVGPVGGELPVSLGIDQPPAVGRVGGLGQCGTVFKPLHVGKLGGDAGGAAAVDKPPQAVAGRSHGGQAEWGTYFQPLQVGVAPVDGLEFAVHGVLAVAQRALRIDQAQYPGVGAATGFIDDNGPRMADRAHERLDARWVESLAVPQAKQVAYQLAACVGLDGSRHFEQPRRRAAAAVQVAGGAGAYPVAGDAGRGVLGELHQSVQAVGVANNQHMPGGQMQGAVPVAAQHAPGAGEQQRGLAVRGGRGLGQWGAEQGDWATVGLAPHPDG